MRPWSPASQMPFFRVAIVRGFSRIGVRGRPSIARMTNGGENDEVGQAGRPACGWGQAVATGVSSSTTGC